MDKMGFMPPTEAAVALAAAVNARLRQGAHVTPIRRDSGDDIMLYGFVFTYHDARKPIEREYEFFDADEVVRLVDAWIDGELPHYHATDNWVIAH